jgi:hypothetical protein
MNWRRPDISHGARVAGAFLLLSFKEKDNGNERYDG